MIHAKKRKLIWAISVPALLLFTALNVSAYLHASKMLVFTAGGERTKSVEKLSFSEKAAVLFTGTNIPKPANSASPRDHGFAYLTMPVKTSDGVALECWYLTKAKPAGTILMLHGYASSKDRLLPAAEYFYNKGYNVLIPDFRGSGGSQGNSTSIGYYEAQDVKACFDMIKSEYSFGKPVIIYGRSMGGAAALRAIAEYGIKPDKLILESVFSTMLSAVGNRFRLAGAPAFPLANLLTFWGGVKLGFNAFTHNPRDYAKKCQSPVLLMQGSEDKKATIAQAHDLFSRFSCRKKMKVFKGVNHESPQSAAPGEWAAEVDSFLDLK